ncbi:sensor histidine kinase [Streptomyces scopuliridis]|uniref:sensor histidine kinase n=1 Tax=Streptomyces scopuliridis TaxID=452529 RepID=UPI0036A8A932
MITSWRQYADSHPRTVDVSVALLLFVSTVTATVITSSDPTSLTLWWTAALVEAVGCAALLWHRSHPQTVVVITVLCAGAGGLLGFLLSPLLMAPAMVALYWLALGADRRTARVYCLVAIVLLVPTTLVPAHSHHIPLVFKTVNVAFSVALPVLLGTAVQLRRAYFGEVLARAEYAERTREEEARHRVAEERMRIARELHDIVAHHLALANAQAGTAAHLARTQPDQVQRILTDLAGTTSSALRELKATVGLLRQTDDADAPLEPSPGLGQLSDLTAAFTSAGLRVTVTTEGVPHRLSPGLDLTAFRIVQEALTNVTKHAAAHTAHVRLVHSPALLTIRVTDDGEGTAPTAPAPGHGFGLIGMRERAHSVGGRLRAGHRPEGGFEVTAELPLPPRNNPTHPGHTEPEEDRDS